MLQFGISVLLAKPPGTGHVLVLPLEPFLQLPHQRLVRRSLVQPLLVRVLQDHVRVVAAHPRIGFQTPPDLANRLAADLP
jgi:hypothetical protein